MAYNGSGTFNRLYDWTDDRDAGIKIRADRMDDEMNGFATGLSTALTKDGQTNPSANLPMATYRHTGVGNGTSRTDYAAVGQVQDSSLIYGGTDTGAADALVFALSPTLPAYAVGQVYVGKVGTGHTNTGAGTVQFSAIGGAKSVKMPDGTDPKAGAMTAGRVYAWTYDGTNFILMMNYSSLVADIAALPPTDSNIIVGNGTTWVAESGATARTSLGLAIGTNVQAYNANIAVTNADNNFSVAQNFAGIISTGAGTVADFNRTGADGAVVTIKNDGTGVGSISISGASTAYNTTSDGRAKENVEEIENAGEIIDAMEPVWFDWRGRFKRDYQEAGFVAQALVKHVPTAVTRGDDNPDLQPDDEGYEGWGVDLSKIVPLLVAEIKALRRRVDQLEIGR